MTTIEIGKGPAGPARIDVDVLLRTRLLLQANSGGGKSWLLRVLAEQLAGKVQTIIIDPEGEFSTLRERFDFFLVGKGGDTPADVRSAPLVAHKLLELGVSAVCDLFEMKPDARHAWVAAFLEAAVDAPKTLWHPCAFLVDEAHVFAPERGAGESPALDGMSAMATRGRKRGYMLGAATQRLGKFRKDVAAELQNVMIGPTFLDVDADRAMDTLGIARGDRKDFAHDLKVMEPGTFFALGRAISVDRIRVKVRGVQSSHPEGGSSTHAAAAPPPPAKIRAILAKLGDLPKEAEEKIATEASLRAEVDRLRREIAGANAVGPYAQRLEAENARLKSEIADLRDRPAKVVNVTTPIVLREDEVALQNMFDDGVRRMTAIADKIRRAAAETRDQVRTAPPPPRETEAVRETTRMFERVARERRGEETMHNGTGAGDRNGAARMLRALAARHPTPLTRSQLATLTGIKATGGTFRTYIGHCITRHHVIRDGEFLRLTDEGLAAAGPVTAIASPRELVAMWRDKLTGKGRDMLEMLATSDVPLPKAHLAAQLGIELTGGTFRTYFGHLTANGLVERAPGGFRVVESLRLA